MKKKIKININQPKKKRLAIILGITIPVVASSALTSIVSCKDKKASDREIIVDPSKSTEAKVETKTTDTGIEIIVSSLVETKAVESIVVMVQNGTESTTLNDTEYTFDKETGKITIKKEVLDKYPGKIVVNPTLAPKVTGIKLSKTDEKILVDDSIQIHATIKTAQNDDKIKWSWEGEDGVVSITPDESESDIDVTVKGLKKGNGKIVANYGSFTEYCKLEVEEAKTSTIQINGKHNVDIDDAATLSFTAQNQRGVDVTSSCTFTSSNNDIAEFAQGSSTLTLKDKAKTQGGSLIITAIYNSSNNEEIKDRFDIEIATFGKLDKTQLAAGACKQATDNYGDIVTPTRYWDQNLNTWVNITALSNGGFLNGNNISIYISKTITTIPTGENRAIGQPVSKIIVNVDNSQYSSTDSSSTECNCIFNKANQTLIVGCKNTTIPNDATTVTTIGENAFYSSNIESITIPSNITSIDNKAFYSTQSLKTISIPSSVQTIGKNCFEDSGLESATLPDSNWIQTGDADKKLLNVATASKNATNLTNCEAIPETVGTNWGYTGISIDSSAKKSAVVKKDDSFANAGITISEWTESVIQNKTNTITIVATAANEISGSIAISGNNGLITEFSNITFTTSSSSIVLTLDTTAWNNVSAQDTLILTFVKQLTISGSVHQLDVNSTDYSTLTIKYGSDTINPTTCTFDVGTNPTISIATASTYAIVTKTELGKTSGGYTNIKCTYPITQYVKAIAYFEIEVGSYNRLSFTTSGTEATVSGFASSFSPDDDYSLIIPSTYYVYNTKYSVTSIADNSQLGIKNSHNLTSVILPSSLVNIGSNTFTDHQLSTITIPAKVTTLGTNCFMQTTSNDTLKTVNFASSCQLGTIGQKAFANNAGITSITIPSLVSTIETQAFSSCTGLSTIKIPSSVSSIGTSAFENGCADRTVYIDSESVAMFDNDDSKIFSTTSTIYLYNDIILTVASYIKNNYTRNRSEGDYEVYIKNS